MGSVASDSATDISDLTLTIKFTASQILRDAITKVSIGSVVFSNTAPTINKIINWFTGEESTTLTVGKNVIIEGKKLKVGTENSGLYLASVDEKGEIISDEESSWIDCTNLIRQNTPKKIDFYLPNEVSDDSSYRIVIKSDYVNGSTKRKAPIYTYSDVVTVQAM